MDKIIIFVFESVDEKNIILTNSNLSNRAERPVIFQVYEKSRALTD